MLQKITLKIGFLVVLQLALSACGNQPQKPGKQDVPEIMQVFQRAEEQYQQGLLDQAEANYRKVVDQAPDVSEAWLRLGNIHVRTGFLSAAIEMYEKCVEVDPEDVRCWHNMAATRLKQSMDVLDRARLGGFIQNQADKETLDAMYSKIIRVMKDEPTL